MNVTSFDIFKDGAQDAVAHPYVVGLFGLDIGHELRCFLFDVGCFMPFGSFEIEEVFKVCMKGYADFFKGFEGWDGYAAL